MRKIFVITVALVAGWAAPAYAEERYPADKPPRPAAEETLVVVVKDAGPTGPGSITGAVVHLARADGEEARVRLTDVDGMVIETVPTPWLWHVTVALPPGWEAVGPLFQDADVTFGDFLEFGGRRVLIQGDAAPRTGSPTPGGGAQAADPRPADPVPPPQPDPAPQPSGVDMPGFDEAKKQEPAAREPQPETSDPDREPPKAEPDEVVVTPFGAYGVIHPLPDDAPLPETVLPDDAEILDDGTIIIPLPGPVFVAPETDGPLGPREEAAPEDEEDDSILDQIDEVLVPA